MSVNNDNIEWGKREEEEEESKSSTNSNWRYFHQVYSFISFILSYPILLYHSWLAEEEFDNIQSNFAMEEESDENAINTFSYDDLSPFLITLTVLSF